MLGREIVSFCRAYMRMQPPLPIRHSQMAVLEMLCSLPGVHTPVSIAEYIGVSRPMVAAHLSALQKAGYITRVPSPDDGRSVYVLPTKSGKKLMLNMPMQITRFCWICPKKWVKKNTMLL